MAAAVVAGVVKQPTTNCSRILISVSAQKNFDLQPKSSALKCQPKTILVVTYDQTNLSKIAKAKKVVKGYLR